MNEPHPKFPFTPAPVRARHDGWTVEWQCAFIEALAETGIVEHVPPRRHVAYGRRQPPPPSVRRALQPGVAGGRRLPAATTRARTARRIPASSSTAASTKSSSTHATFRPTRATTTSRALCE